LNDLFFVRTRVEYFDDDGQLRAVYENFERGTTGHAVPKLYKIGTAKSLVNQRNKRQYPTMKTKAWLVPVTITYPEGETSEQATQTR
jgi:hypothetical protein